MLHIYEASCLNPGVIKNEQHSIKPGILYSFDFSQRARKGIVNSGIEVDLGKHVRDVGMYISKHIKDE